MQENTDIINMAATRPLVFVYPLTESLQRLKDVISEVAQEENIEIFEVDDQVEINQLMPTLGQSLTLFGEAKKCATTLQINKKFIKAYSSKAILLGDKQLPRKTIEKFQKIGLTEFIMEPVPPKTLLFKVKLLMRSIKLQDKREEEEANVKEKVFTGEDNSSSDKENLKQQRIEKMVRDDEEEGGLSVKRSENKSLQLENEEEEEKKRLYQEGTIQKEWKGKSGSSVSLEMEKEGDDKKKNNSQDHIETFYKNKSEKKLDIQFEEGMYDREKKEKSLEDFSESDYQKTRKSNSINLNLQENTKKNRDQENASLSDDKYLKGKLSGFQLEALEEDEEKKKREEEISDDDNVKNKKKSNIEDLKIEEDKKRKTNLDEESEIEKEKRKNNSTLTIEELEEELRKNKKEFLLDLEKKERDLKDEIDDLSEKNENARHRPGLDSLHLEEDEKKSNENELNKIEKYMKGKSNKNLSDELDLTPEDLTPLSDVSEEEEEDEATNGRAEGLILEVESDDESKKKKNQDDLFIDKEKNNNIDLEKIEENEEGHDKKQNEINLNLFDNKKNSHLDEDFEEEDMSGAFEKRNLKNTNLKLANDDKKNRDSDEEEYEGDYQRRKASKELLLESDKEKTNHTAHTEKIVTTLDSRKGIKHQEYDWENLNKKGYKDEERGDKKTKGQVDISFAEKIDYGEQTIDYRKLWEEFGGITIDREGNVNKRNGPTYVSGEIDKNTEKGVYNNGANDSTDDSSFDSQEQDIEIDDETVYIADPKGIETVIEALSLYYEKVQKPEDIFSFIAYRLFVDYNAVCIFFLFDKIKGLYEEKYNGHIDLSTSQTEKNSGSESGQHWRDFKEANIARWQELTLPQWNDETFQNSDNYLFYPYFEGLSKMGFVIIEVPTSLESTKANTIELITESARGAILEFFHDGGNKGTYAKVKSIEKNIQAKKNEKGFIKKLFGIFFKKAS